MKTKYRDTLSEMGPFLLFWSSQSFSSLGSAMTGYALVIWSYTQSGSALRTAMLMVSTYAPYVLLSVFAGALSDQWNKKRTLLVCDFIAACTTVAALILLRGGMLRIWHLYLINSIGGISNTLQQPASEVATTRILPKKYYQKVGGLRYLSNSCNSILTPILATAIMGLVGLEGVIFFDLFTFVTAFLVLALLIRIPDDERIRADKKNGSTVSDDTGQNGIGQKNADKSDAEQEKIKRQDSVLALTKEGIVYLRQEKGIFGLMMYLAAINLVASVYDAAFPAMMLSREGGSEQVLGMVNAVIGVTTLLGSLIASLVKKPKSRVRMVEYCLLFSMSTENFMLAFGRTQLIWCIGGFCGWILIPLMSGNLDTIYRLRVPEEMQGRFYAVRNSFQFFTIPVGYLLGGILVDYVFEPVMARQTSDSVLVRLFGMGKGSGAAFLFGALGIAGVMVCLYFRGNKHIKELKRQELRSIDNIK